MARKTYLILAALFCYCLFNNALLVYASPPPRILVIHSFHKGDKWDEDLGYGIKEGLADSTVSGDIVYEFMDSQRYPDYHNMQLLYQSYAYKYLANPPDIVVTTDENALQFILEYHDVLFPNIPVVFCGIKYFDEDWLYGEKNITGIVEEADIGKNIELARQISFDLEELLVVVDNSDTSIATSKAIISWLSANPGIVNIRFTSLLTMEELQNTLGELSENSVVLLVNFTIDGNGQLFSPEQSAQIISSSSPVPVLTMWDNYLSHGVLGGNLISGKDQGRQTADLVLKMLHNTDKKEIPVVRHSASKYIFDFEQLKRHKIKSSRLPEPKTIVNLPFSFYEQYKVLIYSSISGSVFLSSIILFLSLNIVKRRRVEKKLKQYSKRLNFLYKADEMILNSVTLESLGEKTLELNRSTFRYSYYAIILKGFEQKEHHIFASSPQQYEALAGVVVNGKDILSADYIWPEKGSLYGTDENVHISAIPIQFQKELLGVLLFGHETNVSDPKFTRVNEELARSMATAISNLRLFMQSRRHEAELKKISAHIIAAQENERKHLSHELHDELGQALTAVGLNLRLVKKKVKKNEVDNIIAYLDETEEYINNISDQVHNMSLDLRPSMLDDLGLVATVRWYLNHCTQRTELSTQLKTQGDLETVLPDAVNITLYRIIQETLNNVVKHAHATHVDIFLRIRATEVELFINDNGKGFLIKDIRKENLGIFGMRERLETLGGTLKIHSTPGSGSTVIAAISLDDKNGSN